jgi:hypothetical protein
MRLVNSDVRELTRPKIRGPPGASSNIRPRSRLGYEHFSVRPSTYDSGWKSEKNDPREVGASGGLDQET